MATVANLNDLDLPEVVGQFSLAPSRLIVFAGDSKRGRTTAYALAEHIGSTTGRKVTAITSGTGPVPSGTTAGHRPAAGYEETSRAIREEAAATEAPVILVDATLDTDSLWEMVKATDQGALVVATMDPERQCPYVHLIDLIWAAEDWGGGFRRDFEASLYAVVTQTIVDTDSGKALVTDLHLGSKLQH